VACVSDYTWKQMQAMGIKPQMERVIPNGADPSKFRVLPDREVNEFRSGLGFGSRSRLIMTVGNVSRRKGQDIVIRALPLVLKEVSDVHYMIVGLPTLKEELEQLARQLGVAERVHFLGRLENKVLLYFLNCCDVFAMTSRNTADGDFEGYGIAVVEAALCGKPAVVTADCGLAEAVIPGKTGVVVPQEDERETAAALVELLSDQHMREKMGEAANLRALTEQTWSRRARKYDELLRSIVPLPQPQADRIFMEASYPKKWNL